MQPLATLGQGEYTLDGSPRLRQRPLAPLVEALRALGAHLEYLEEPGYLPLRVTAGGLQGGRVVFGDLDSSQYVSSLLMIGLFFKFSRLWSLRNLDLLLLIAFAPG